MKNMAALFISIFALTVGDAFCSAWEVREGWMTEGNPLIHDAVMTHPVLACAVITAVVGMILYGIWKVRNRIKWLPAALIVVLAVKVGIMGMHVAGLYQILNR